MRRKLAAGLVAVVLLGACSSGQSLVENDEGDDTPDNPLQVPEKAREREEQVETRDSTLEQQIEQMDPGSAP